MLTDKPNVQASLEAFRDYVIQQSRSNLTKQRRNVSRKLYRSLSGTVKVNANSFEFDFEMEEHGQYLDKGVRGKTSSSKAPNSPFKFGSGTGKKGGLTNGILKWVKAKRLQFKDKKTGRFLSYESTGFLITRSIYHKGMKPSLFFTKPFEKAFKRLPDDLIEKFGLDVEAMFNQTIKQP